MNDLLYDAVNRLEISNEVERARRGEGYPWRRRRMDREQLPTFLHGITCVFAGLSLPPSARETFDKSIVFQGDGIKDEAESPPLLANYRNSPGELACFTFDAPRTKRIGGKVEFSS